MKKFIAIFTIIMLIFTACSGERKVSFEEFETTAQTVETTNAITTARPIQTSTPPQTTTSLATTTFPSQTTEQAQPTELVQQNNEVEVVPPVSPSIDSSSPPSGRISLGFNSIDEIRSDDSWTRKSEYEFSKNEKLEMFEIDEKNKGEFRSFISNAQRGSFLYVPHYQGKEVSYSNRGEGFNNIELSNVDFYGHHNMTISFSINDKQNGIGGIEILSLKGDAIEKAKREDISKFVEEISPVGVTAQNYHEYPHFSRIYTSELQLSDRTVNAVIYEYTADYVYMRFVYDDSLILISTFNEKVALEWMRGLSFEKR